MKAIDIGARITVGLEVSYHLSKGATTSKDDWSVLINAVPEYPESQLRQLYDVNAIRYDTSRIDDAPLNLLIDGLSTHDPEAFSSLNEFHVGDSDDWLYLTPEEFDAELNSSIQRELIDSSQVPTSGHRDEPAGVSAPSKESDDLNDIIRGVESFFREKSGVEGVEREEQAAKPSPDTAGLNIDMDKVLALLQAKGAEKVESSDSDSDDEEPEDDIDMDGPEPEIDKAALPGGEDDMASDEEESDAEDSTGSDAHDESFFDEYAASMEEELMGSSLFETFERQVRLDGSLGDVDIRLNLIKNLLEANVQNLGAPGPIEGLLKQLGVKLPRPPGVDS